MSTPLQQLKVAQIKIPVVISNLRSYQSTYARLFATKATDKEEAESNLTYLARMISAIERDDIKLYQIEELAELLLAIRTKFVLPLSMEKKVAEMEKQMFGVEQAANLQHAQALQERVRQLCGGYSDDILSDYTFAVLKLRAGDPAARDKLLALQSGATTKLQQEIQKKLELATDSAAETKAARVVLSQPAASSRIKLRVVGLMGVSGFYYQLPKGAVRASSVPGAKTLLEPSSLFPKLGGTH